MNLQFLIQLLVNGLVVGTLYGVVAMSFVLIYKATQVVNFAQGELLLIGAWVCWALLTKYQVPFWIGMPIALVFMFAFGIALQVAQSLGISVKSVFAMAWAISATVSAVAGVVVAVVNGVSSGLSGYGIKVFPAAILGGLDSIGGAVLGGIIIGLLENIAQFVDSEYLHWGNLYEIAPFYVLIIILMIKPYGLFGTKDIERV